MSDVHFCAQCGSQGCSARVRELEARLAMAEAAAEEAGKLVTRFRSQRDELRGTLGGFREWPDLPRVEHHVERNGSGGIPFGRVTVDGDLAYKGRWNSGLQALVDGAMQTELALLALREVIARAALYPAPTDEDKP